MVRGSKTVTFPDMEEEEEEKEEEEEETEERGSATRYGHGGRR